jgi:hypothetical protein
MAKQKDNTGVTLGLLSAGGLALAGIFAQRQRAQQGQRRGDRNRDLRPVPQGYSSDPRGFMSNALNQEVNYFYDQDRFPDEDFSEEVALYHVTTARDAVLGSRLKSREQLRAQVGEQGRSYGLGGGEDQAHLVSVGVMLDGARRVAAALQAGILAAQGRLSAPEAVLRVFEWTGFPRSVKFVDVRDRSDEAYVAIFEMLVDKETADETTVEEILDLRDWQWRAYAKAMPKDMEPCDVVRLILGLETSIFSMGIEHGITGCLPAVRMLEDCEKMARMKADQVAILAVAAKTSARPTEILSECELRFDPKDLVVLGEVQ